MNNGACHCCGQNHQSSGCATTVANPVERLVISKPSFREACNNCGKCCETELCEVGKAAYGAYRLPPCPALNHDNLCAIVKAEQMLAPYGVISKALGIGCGCSMPDAETSDKEIEYFDEQCRKLVYG